MPHPERSTRGDRTRGFKTFHRLVATGPDARFQGATDPARTDPERVDGDAEALGQTAAALDALAPRLTVVLDGELPLIGLQRVQAAIETFEAAFFRCRRLVGDDGLGRRNHRETILVDANIASLAANVLEQHEPR